MIENGISSISIRSICIEAGVNLGMFHYYFKSKENFIKILLENLIQDLQNYWFKEMESLSTPKERLERVLFLNAKLYKEKKGVVETMLKGFDFSNEFFIKMIKETHKIIYAFFFTLMNDCKNDGSLDKNIDNYKLVSILFGATMNYAKYCAEVFAGEQYDEEILHMINLLMEKCK
ncbi:MAG: TetR/AcrR family transcriptional regulator [Endomicrobia bacterium]|nr:TetR/AcrR family transcriptional regulator [Endomicrobiia bacterium]MCL2507373.1 TetR/AcrR family transcriptional regulator [Endomicrobiia bacterium]